MNECKKQGRMERKDRKEGKEERNNEDRRNITDQEQMRRNKVGKEGGQERETETNE